MPRSDLAPGRGQVAIRSLTAVLLWIASPAPASWGGHGAGAWGGVEAARHRSCCSFEVTRQSMQAVIAIDGLDQIEEDPDGDAT